METGEIEVELEAVSVLNPAQDSLPILVRDTQQVALPTQAA